jgi:hypothetical protein
MYAQQYAIYVPYVKQFLSTSTFERERKSFPRGNHCPLQRRSKTGCTTQTVSFQIVTRGSQDVNMTTHLPSQTETKNAESHTSTHLSAFTACYSIKPCDKGNFWPSGRLATVRYRAFAFPSAGSRASITIQKAIILHVALLLYMEMNLPILI